MNARYFTIFMFLFMFCCSAMADHQSVRKIILRGNEAFSDEQLRLGMQTEVGETYDEELLRKDFKRIVGFYRKNGFSFARIDEKRLFKKGFADGVYLHIYIDEGRIGQLTVEGNSRTRDHVILRELLFKTGDVYTVEDELESERILRRKPYLGDAEIGATWDDETSTVEIRVMVTDLWSVIPALDVYPPLARIVPTFSCKSLIRICLAPAIKHNFDINGLARLTKRRGASFAPGIQIRAFSVHIGSLMAIIYNSVWAILGK